MHQKTQYFLQSLKNIMNWFLNLINFYQSATDNKKIMKNFKI